MSSPSLKAGNQDSFVAAPRVSSTDRQAGAPARQPALQQSQARWPLQTRPSSALVVRESSRRQVSLPDVSSAPPEEEVSKGFEEVPIACGICETQVHHPTPEVIQGPRRWQRSRRHGVSPRTQVRGVSPSDSGETTDAWDARDICEGSLGLGVEVLLRAQQRRETTPQIPAQHTSDTIQTPAAPSQPAVPGVPEQRLFAAALQPQHQQQAQRELGQPSAQDAQSLRPLSALSPCLQRPRQPDPAEAAQQSRTEEVAAGSNPVPTASAVAPPAQLPQTETPQAPTSGPPLLPPPSPPSKSLRPDPASNQAEDLDTQRGANCGGVGQQGSTGASEVYDTAGEDSRNEPVEVAIAADKRDSEPDDKAAPTSSLRRRANAAIEQDVPGNAGKQSEAAPSEQALSPADRRHARLSVLQVASQRLQEIPGFNRADEERINKMIEALSQAADPHAHFDSSTFGDKDSGMEGSRSSRRARAGTEYLNWNKWNGGGESGDEFCEEDMTELEELKISTFHKMRQDITYQAEETRWSCPFMYLTSKQASRITRGQMPQLRHVMDLEGHKMVIRLFPSPNGPKDKLTHPFESDVFPCRDLGELAVTLGESLSLLAKEVLLPLAIQTQALVIGTDSCDLGLAFLEAAAPVQRCMGDKCPFKVLFFLRAPWFDNLATNDRSSNVHRFKKNCTPWLEASQNLREARQRKFGANQSLHPCGELIPGRYSLIMFECLASKKNIYDKVAHSFQNEFVASLAETHPVIGLQTLGAGINLLPTLADHASRGMPLMLIDAHNRAAAGCQTAFGAPDKSDPDEVLERCRVDLQKFSQDMQEQGRSDRLTASMLAYLKRVIDLKIVKGCSTRKAQKNKWIWEAIEDPGKVQGAVSDRIYTKATQIFLTQAGKNCEWERLWRRNRCKTALDEIITQSTSWANFKNALSDRDRWLALRQICFFREEDMANFEEVAKSKDWEAWCRFTEAPNKDDWPMGRELHLLGEDNKEKDQAGKQCPLQEALREFEVYCRGKLEKAAKFDKEKKSEAAYRRNTEVSLAVYSILKNPDVSTENLSNLKACEHRLSELAKKIDRLPRENSLAALILLRRAWTLVDLFDINAKFYKRMSKLLYGLGLFIGVLIIVLQAVLTTDLDTVVNEDRERFTLLGLALAMSAVNAVTTGFEPARKWSQLRGAGLVLTKEIWKFRTRVEKYSTTYGAITQVDAEREAEDHFRRVIEAIQAKVIQTPGIMDTDFFAAVTASDDIHRDRLNELYHQDTEKKKDKQVENNQNRSAMESMLSRLASCRKSCLAKSPKLRWARWGWSSNAHYTHHQYRKEGDQRFDPDRKQDNFQSPSSPYDYITFRMMPAREFYTKRIPIYACRRLFFKVVAIVASLTAAFLAAMAWQNWMTIVASLAGCFAAWQEYTGAARKLERYSYVEAYMREQDVSIAIYNILKDKNIQTGNLHNLKECEKKLSQLAKNVERLPEANSLATLILLRRAWTLVDLFNRKADSYKLTTKALHGVSLLLGLLIVCFHTFATNNRDLVSDEQEQYIQLTFALLMSAVNAMIAAVEPSRKWMQLRGGSLALEKEIWKFRARVGEYANSYGALRRVGAEREAEREFQQFVQGIQEKVLQSAGLMDTDFFRQPTCVDDLHDDEETPTMGARPKGESANLRQVRPLPSSDQPQEDENISSENSDKPDKTDQQVPHPKPKKKGFCCRKRLGKTFYQHHQYSRGPKRDDTFLNSKRKRPNLAKDNFHSPANPNDYISFRLMPALKFYRGRIPTYHCRRRLFQIVAVITSLTASGLAALAWHQWTAIVANIAGSFVAWQEYVGTTKKLERYSYVVSSLENIMVWWQALPQVEHSIVQHVEDLVHDTEALLGRDHAAWLSDAQRNEMRRAAAEDRGASKARDSAASTDLKEYFLRVSAGPKAEKTAPATTPAAKSQASS